MTNELIEELEAVYQNLVTILRNSTPPPGVLRIGSENIAYHYRRELEKNTTELKRIINKINEELE